MKGKALSFINRFRQYAGIDTILSLPKAIPGDPSDCVLAKAVNFDIEVDGEYFATESLDVATALGKATNQRFEVYDEGYGHTTYHVNIPQYLRQFIQNFDTGKYADLLDDGYRVAKDEYGDLEIERNWGTADKPEWSSI